MIIPDNGSVVLFDGGYLFFYRYHATLKNLKFRFKDDELTPDIICNNVIDHLDKQLAKTVKKFKASMVIFCLDIHLKDVWRTQVYPEYKGTRKHEDIPVTDDIKDRMLQVMKKHGMLLTQDRLEADDVAYLCVKSISDKSDIDINIITNDNDFMQLLKYKHVRLFTGGLKEKVGDPRIELLKKVLAGDPSDNIPAVCGKTQANRLIEEGDEAIEQYLKKNENVRKQYELNKTLIDMDNVPASYQATFRTNFDKL